MKRFGRGFCMLIRDDWTTSPFIWYGFLYVSVQLVSMTNFPELNSFIKIKSNFLLDIYCLRPYCNTYF